MGDEKFLLRVLFKISPLRLLAIRRNDKAVYSNPKPERDSCFRRNDSIMNILNLGRNKIVRIQI